MVKRILKPFISMIVPCYKAETFIVSSLTHVDAQMRRLTRDYEIICVVDGKVDNTFDLASNLAKKLRNIRVVSYLKNRGKGYAVRYGMKLAKGKCVGFIDAGGEIDPASLVELVKIFNEKKADIVVGSKRHPNSDIVYPPLRRVFSFVYLYFVKMLFGIKLSDTQAGIKLFRKEAIKKLLPNLRVNGFAFDIEMLTLAKIFGFKGIYEAPIKVRMVKGETASTIGNIWQLVNTSFEMVYDSLKLYSRIQRGKL